VEELVQLSQDLAIIKEIKYCLFTISFLYLEYFVNEDPLELSKEKFEMVSFCCFSSYSNYFYYSIDSDSKREEILVAIKERVMLAIIKFIGYRSSFKEIIASFTKILNFSNIPLCLITATLSLID
jgi:hypothetical protein